MREHPFLPLTDTERKLLLKEIGVLSFNELLKEIPEEVVLKEPLSLPEPLSEMELRELIASLSEENERGYISFIGGGVYDHFVPSVIEHIVGRSEFYTSYTSYQAEVSQGILQAMFEFQSCICELTGMEVANSSMYCGASALAEAVLMSLRIRGTRQKVLYPKNLNPIYLSVIKTYLQGLDAELLDVDYKKSEGTVDIDDLEQKIDSDTACFILQTPNFFGCIEDPFPVEEIVKRKGALLISVFDPISLGVIATPGEYGADIAVAEGQPLGIPPSFGGPYLGLFTSRLEYIRNMPGRIVGETVDTDGKRGYVMVLQTREQHIRREKATSNICTNQMLCALRALVYLSVMGKKGIKEVALQCISKSQYLIQKLRDTGRVNLAFSRPSFKEFVLKLPLSAEELADKMEKIDGILPGIPLSRFGLDEDMLLVAITEKKKREELDRFVEILERYTGI